MFSLFKALFGGLYYGGKIINEKASTAEAVEKNKNIRISRDNFEIAYAAPFDMEQDVKDYISCGEHYQKICDTLKEDLIYAIGEDWEQQIDIPNGNYKVCDFSSHLSTTYWIYHLLLAHKGKMSRWRMSSGYMVNNIALHSQDVSKNKIIRPRNIRFLQLIEKRLIENNVSIKLVEDSSDYTVKPDIFCSYPSRRLW